MEKTDISSSAPIGFLRLSSTLSMCILAPWIYPWESIIILISWKYGKGEKLQGTKPDEQDIMVENHLPI